MTTLSISTLLLLFYGALARTGFCHPLALGGATGAGAALVLGELAVPTFYAVAMGVVLALVVRSLRSRDRGLPRERLPPGANLLLAFLAWSALVTVVAPFLFNGLPVLSSSGEPAELVAGAITSSNIAQNGYLLLGVCVVVYLARSPNARPELIGLAVGLAVALSFWRYLHGEVGVPFPEDVFDTSPNLVFVETAPGGGERFRGILSEPASLAIVCVVAVGYFVARLPHVGGVRRLGCLTMAAIAVVMGIESTSASFVVAGAVVLGAAAIVQIARLLFSRVTLNVAGLLIGITVVVAALWVLPVIAAYVDSTVDEKTGSASSVARDSSNDGSWQILFDSGGLGVGLGASRGSAFLPSLLSTTGIIGVLLFGSAVVVLVVRGWRHPEYRPVVWALLGLLVVKAVSGPDLSDPTGVLWMSLGLLSGAVLRDRGARSAERPSALLQFSPPTLARPPDPGLPRAAGAVIPHGNRTR